MICSREDEVGALIIKVFRAEFTRWVLLGGFRLRVGLGLGWVGHYWNNPGLDGGVAEISVGGSGVGMDPVGMVSASGSEYSVPLR